MKKLSLHENELSYANFYLDQLFENVLKFWIPASIDHELGGFMTCLDQTGKVFDSDKSVWAQGRFTWLLGDIYNRSKTDRFLEQRIDKSSFSQSDFLELAKHGANFLKSKCFDKIDGRMWFHLTRKGEPIRKRRYSFTESFAAIAFGEVANATQSDSMRQLAIECFDAFLYQGERAKLEPQKFTQSRITKSIGLPMIAIATAQELRDSIQLENANDIIDQAISEIQNEFICEEHSCVLETVYVNQKEEQFEHFDGRQLNPGHAIEAAWFIIEEAYIRGRTNYMELGLKMLKWMWEIGWDKEFGGMLYFKDALGKEVQDYWHDMKFWWPHNEAIIAAALAWKITGQDIYADMHKLVHDWSFKHFADSEHGEWFGYLRRDGQVSQRAKGNLWKGPFHLPRMLLLCSQILTRDGI